MSPEKEIELFETVATISADLRHVMNAQTDMASKLEEHTKADSDNFEKLSKKIDGLTNKFNIDDAIKADDLEDAKKSASRRAAFVSVVVSAVSVALGAWLQKFFHLN